MSASGILSREQRSVLATVFRFTEGAEVYFRSMVPVVGKGKDERLLKAMIELAESCMRSMVRFFPEL